MRRLEVRAPRELLFQGQPVQAARYALLLRGADAAEGFSLELTLNTAAQLQPFLDFLSAFATRENLQAAAYLPDSELRLRFAPMPPLLERFQGPKPAAGWNSLWAPDGKVDLDSDYHFEQMEMGPPPV